jgi:tripartite motif-containing protein 71
VTDTLNNRVKYFSAEGSFLGAWGSSGKGDGEFFWPYGVGISPDGYVYVADRLNYRIQYFTLDGSFVGKWGSEGSGDGEFNGPYGVAVADDGTVYVTDSHIWFAYITSFGKNDRSDPRDEYPPFDKRLSNNSPGAELNNELLKEKPGGVYWVGEYPTKYRVQYFTREGSFIGKWEVAGRAGRNRFIPFGIAAAPNGDVYVTDLLHPRVIHFSPTGSFKGTWGSKGRGEGEFENPEGIAVGPGGFVYVTDYDSGRVQYFTSTGSFLGQWGSEGSGAGRFKGPQGIAVSRKGYIYVSDSGNGLIQCFRPVR